MKWLQADVIVGPDEEEIAIASLASAGCSSVQVIRNEDLPEFDEPGAPATSGWINAARRSSESVIVRGYAPFTEDPRVAIQMALDRAGVDTSPSGAQICVTTVEDPGWARSWRKYFRPIRIAGRLVVTPPWSRYRPRPGEDLIVLEPGMAFGTGQHATTRLCLQALVQVAQPGAVVLDVGCGSGILSIAAVRLGASRVVGMDIDGVAVATAKENAARNGVENAIEFRRSSLKQDELRGVAADVIVANILTGVILEMLPEVRTCLSTERSGHFIASGIPQSQSDQVVEALEPNGMRVVEVMNADGWSCLITELRP